MRKKIIFFIVLLAICLSTKAQNTGYYDFAAQSPSGHCLYYRFDNNNVMVVNPMFSSYGHSISGDLTIPNTVTYNGNTYTVTGIGLSAFSGIAGLNSVIIGDSVTLIGSWAFNNCIGLTSITMGESVTNIASESFRGCINLSSVEIPNSVTSIGDMAFYGCVNLNSVGLPNALTTIGFGVFASCNNLTSINIPSTVTLIDDQAFSNCIGLSTLTIPNSVNYIGKRAFYNCTGLHNLSVGSSVAYIGNQAFAKCNNMESISVSNDNPYYDSRLNCNAIIQTNQNCLILGCKNTVIPGSITSLGSKAFYECTGLTSLTIPSSIITIGDSVFMNCSNLRSISIPNAVTQIGVSAFEGCISLNSVSIPNSIVTIGRSAFRNCNSLTSIFIPNSVNTIEEYAFYECTGLTSINIPTALVWIKEGTFANCSGLTAVFIHNNVGYISAGAFSGCSNLTEITSCSSVAPTLSNNVFYGVPDSVIITIPCGSSPSYYERWGYFQNFVENAEIMLDATTSDSTMGTVSIITAPTCQNNTAFIQAIANEGYIFDHWSDGNTDNPRTLSIDTYTNIVGVFSSLDNIDDIETIHANVYSSKGCIIVEEAEKNNICVYDVYGHPLASKHDNRGCLKFNVSVSGIYLVKIGNQPARKVVVIK